MILSKNLPVENGVNRVLLRAGKSAGTVRLRATGEGLKDAVVTIAAAAPPKVTGGLSTDFAENHQPGLLTRGPTPTAPTYHVTRSTHVPSRAVSAANVGDVGSSFDDNELTLWKSDGKPSTAWVEYQFDQPATFNAIDLKLAGWNSRSYPLRITVDGKTVWEGGTERQLGYEQISFPATSGKTVRITQLGPTANRDAFKAIVEVDATLKAGDTGADQVKAGWELGIIEADFHGPVNP